MAKVVYKYGVTVAAMGTLPVELPIGAEILRVDKQQGDVVLWALVDTEVERTESVDICVVGTGQPLPKGDWKFVNTFLLMEGSFVFHVFRAR